MSDKIPPAVLQELRSVIYEKLDSVNYLCQGRVANGKFMEQLARDPDIGGRIAQYTGKERVKTYIKDAVINRYSKERTRLPQDLTITVCDAVGGSAKRIKAGAHVELYECEDGKLVVVSKGRLLKWETALRKLLEFLGSQKHAMSTRAGEPRKLLILSTGGQKVASTDVDFVNNSLATIGVTAKLL